MSPEIMELFAKLAREGLNVSLSADGTITHLAPPDTRSKAAIRQANYRNKTSQNITEPPPSVTSDGSPAPSPSLSSSPPSLPPTPPIPAPAPTLPSAPPPVAPKGAVVEAVADEPKAKSTAKGKKDWREWNQQQADRANIVPLPMDFPGVFIEPWQRWCDYRTRRATESRISSEAVAWTRDSAEAGIRACKAHSDSLGWDAVIQRIDEAIQGAWQGFNFDKLRTPFNGNGSKFQNGPRLTNERTGADGKIYLDSK